MHIKTTSKRALAHLLLFTLIISAAFNYAISSNIHISIINSMNLSSTSAEYEHSDSTMGCGSNSSFDYAEANDSYINTFSGRLLNLQNLKINIPFLVEVTAVATSCFLYYSRLSREIFIHKNNDTITNFLHKKDGKK